MVALAWQAKVYNEASNQGGTLNPVRLVVGKPANLRRNS